MARKVVALVMLVPLVVGGLAGADGAADAVGIPFAPGEDCVPAGSLAAAVLAAARSGQPVRIGSVDVPALRVSTDFPLEEATMEVGRPHSLSGPVHFFRQASLEPGSDTVAGYVKCDFMYGVLNQADGRQVEFGERPAPWVGDRPHPVLPVEVEDSTPDTSHMVQLPPVHAHSIHVTKHIYHEDPAGPSDTTDPINAVFYDTVRPTVGHMLWDETPDYFQVHTYCFRNNPIAEDHPAWFWDGQHADTDRWHYTDEEWATEVQADCDHGRRFHLRLLESVGGDTHTPSFKGYMLSPVHEDKCECTNPSQSGQDHLWMRIATNHHMTTPPRTVIVNPGQGECPACDPPKWNGEVDLYEAGSNWAGNPEEGAQCGSVHASSGNVGGWPDLHLTCQAASFTTVRGNEWWVQANVAASGLTVNAVDVRLNGGVWKPLTKQTWGAWAASYQIVQGTVVQLRATLSNGAQNLSPCYRWIPPANVDATVVSCEAAFDATFTGVTGNEWWVEVKVTGNQPISAVHARVNCAGSWIALSPTNWGTWAKSFNVPAGSRVDFRATSNTGATDRSGAYFWPTATPAPACP